MVMPVAVKELHMATSLTELKETSAVDIVKFKDRSYQKLVDSAKKLYQNAMSKLEEEETDEELAYVYLFRAMEMWQLVMKSPEFLSDKKYFQLMHGKEMKKTIDSLEEHSKKLQERYAALENGSVSKSKETLRNQYKLTTNVIPKKRKEGKDSDSEKTNGATTPMITDQRCLEDYNIKFNVDVPKLDEEYYSGDKKFIECEVLKEKIIGSFLDILIIDIRPKKDYKLSKISTVHCVNIPGSTITPGLSANKLGGLITDEDERRFWGQRDQYDQLVLLDWYSEQKDVIPNSPLSNLHIILTKWDPDCIYKNNPLILNGGFERFLDTYPTFTTNAKITCPVKPTSSPFIHLSEHNIEYPMNVLEEERISFNTTTTPNLDDTGLITPISRPIIDRSTKPHQLTEKMDSSNNIPNGVKSIERSVTILESNNHFIIDDNMEEEKVISPKASHAVDLPADTSQFKERPLDSKVNSVASVPPRPSTPPRSEKSKVLSSKVNTVAGDGDGEIYLERTKFDTPSRSGLKRSASSPNINKLGEEELDQSSWVTPVFDRSTKPKHTPSFDFMPRSAVTDTVYLADHNKKGRGLTGLKNLGNLCYMNSIMQCISNTVELRQELTKFNVKECRGGRQIASEVSSLLRTLWQGDTRTTSCRNLKARVGSYRHSFSTMEQQDSHEFLTILVDWLHEDLNEPSPIKSLKGAEEATGEKAWGEFRQKNNSVVLDLFYGQLKSTVTCEHCQTQSVLFEPFSNLSIPLPSSQDDKDRTFTLQECLKLYLKGEPISGWVCPNCKTARKATKKLDITRLPPVLIIHLKRFMNDMVGVGWCRKRMNMVDFPISDLDMKPYTHPESELRFHNYNLYAVSNHYGSMESGHYTAYCKNHMLNKWYKFDDQDVNEISTSEVKSSAAYILFYESSQFETQCQRILD